MSCLHPIFAVSLGTNPNTGKKIMKVKGHLEDNVQKLFDKYGSENVYFLPCGKCSECIKSRKREWAIRCELEAKTHQENCFVTLTYDDEHNPGHLVKKDLQDFIRYLRRSGVKCRYFGCGELGDLSKRPHYHIILFGWKPKDLRYYSKTKSGGYQFTSKFLDGIWKKGFLTVSDFEPGLGAYVAGYVAKKMNDDDGFILMSTRPGIGFEYFTLHIQEIYDNDNIIVSFGSHVAKVPRYLDKIAETLAVDLTSVKEKRASFANLSLHQTARDSGLRYLDQVFAQRASKKSAIQAFRKRDII